MSKATPYFDTQQILIFWKEYSSRPEVTKAINAFFDILSLPQQISQLSTLQCILYKYLAFGVFPDSNLNKLLEQYIEVLAATTSEQQPNSKSSRQATSQTEHHSQTETHSSNGETSSKNKGVIIVLDKLTHNTQNMVRLTGWSGQKRKLLLIKMLPIIYAYRDSQYVQKSLKCLVSFVSSLRYTEEQLLLLMEELSIQKSTKIKTIEGPLMSSHSYLVLSILHNYVQCEQLQHKPQHVSDRLSEIHLLLKNTLTCLIRNLDSTDSTYARGSRQFIHTLLKDSYALTSFLQFPMSLRVTRQLTVQLVSHYMNQDDYKIKLQFMPLLSTMMSKLLGFRNALPDVQIEDDEGCKDLGTTREIKKCVLCQTSDTVHTITTYIIKHRQVQSRVELCQRCIVETSSPDNSINLLPLVIIPTLLYSDFESRDIKSAKNLYLLQLIPDLSHNSRRLQNLLLKFNNIQQGNRKSRPIIQRTGRQKLQGIDKLCLLYLNYSCETLGLKGQLKTLFSYWIIESNALQYVRRVRALKQISISLKAVFTLDDSDEVEQYRKKILKVIETRLLDQHEAVRMESVRALIDIMGLSEKKGEVQIKYVDHLIKKLSDDSVIIRKYILSYIEKNRAALVCNKVNIQYKQPSDNQNQLLQNEEEEVERVFGQLVLSVISRLDDEFSSVRKLAFSALQSLLFGTSISSMLNKKHKIKRQDKNTQRFVKLLTHYQLNEQLIKALISVCSHSPAALIRNITSEILFQIQKISDGDNQNMNVKAPFIFLELLAQQHSSALDQLFDILVTRTSSCFIKGSLDIGAGYTRILSNMDCTRLSLLTKKQRKQAEDLLNHLQNIINSPSSQFLVKDCLKLYVRLKIDFCLIADINNLLYKCEKYLEYAISMYIGKNQQSEDTMTIVSSTGCILQSLMMCTVICLEKQITQPNGEEIVRLYDKIATFMKSSNPYIQNRSLECLSQFWTFNQNLFYHSWTALQTHLPALLVESHSSNLAILAYECLLTRIDSCISNNSGCDNVLILISSLFSKTFNFVFDSQSSALRKLALKMIVRLNQTGMINLFDYTKYVFAYSCDIDDALRGEAAHALLGLEDRVLYHNFYDSMNFCLKHVLKNYGQITVSSGQGSAFFQFMIEKYPVTIPNIKKAVIKQDKYKCSFLKKIGELLNNCLTYEVKLVEFCCCIIDQCLVMTESELQEVKNALDSLIQTQYHEIKSYLKKLILVEEQEDLQISSNMEGVGKIQQAVCLFKVLICYRRLTGMMVQQNHYQRQDDEQTTSQIKNQSKSTKAKQGGGLIYFKKYEARPEIPKTPHQLHKRIKQLYNGEEECENYDRSNIRQKITRRKKTYTHAKSAPKKKMGLRKHGYQSHLEKSQGKTCQIIEQRQTVIQIQCRMKLRDRSKIKYKTYAYQQ